MVLFMSQQYSQMGTPLPYIRLLFHFLRAEIKVAVADPLNLEPVPEVTVPTTLKVHLQAIDVLLLEAAAWRVCVLVEADTISQASLQ